MKNKFFRKAILPSVVALGVAIVSLSSVTYAWFTTGNVADVNNLIVSVDSASGLQIGVNNWDGSKWTDGFKSVVTLDKISDKTLAPVSNNGGPIDNKGDLIFYTATLNDKDGTNPIKEVKKAESGWYSFNLYIDNGKGEKDVKITGSQVTCSEAEHSEYAVRIGFVNEGVFDQSTKAFSSSNSGATVTIWEPNFGSHTDNGLINYKTITGQDPLPEDKSIPTYPCVGTFTSSAGDAGISRFATCDGVLAESTALKSLDTKYFTIPESKISNIRVFVWIEGQDADCLNDISGYDVEVSLKFTATEASK